ncbi:MAG: ankyrin repeat domain-containing protein [Rickettsiaceae bacterium]|nr:ankyrin repeat domain-containing protein [Rickettsiaceae bacterium]
MAKQKTDLNFQKSSWLSKALSFFRIGAWWSGKGAKVEPQDKAVSVETKSEEPEPATGSGSDVSFPPSGSNPNNRVEPTPTSRLSISKIFGNILSFVWWGSRAKSDGQSDNALGEGVSVEQTPKDFTETDLQQAIDDYDYEKVQEIISLHPQFLDPKTANHSPLRHAICFCLPKPDKKEVSLNIVKFLVDEMKKEAKWKASDNSGHLTFAVKCGQIDMVKLFVEEYSATVSSDCLLAAAERKAAQDEHSGEILTFLLEQSIDHEVLDDALRQVARQNTKGAGYEMYNEAIQALIDKGANVNSQDNKDGKTALHIAIYYDKFSTIELLLKNKADHSINNTEGIAPIALMNEKLLRSEKGLANANDEVDVFFDYNQNRAQANNNQINYYELRREKWSELIELCTKSSSVEEESVDDVLVHNPDGVGDPNPVLVDNPLLCSGASDSNNIGDFSAVYPEFGVYDFNSSNLPGTLPLVMDGSNQ